MEPVRISVRVFMKFGRKYLRMIGLDSFDFEKTEVIPPSREECLVIQIDKRGFVRLRVKEDREGEISINAYHGPKGSVIFDQVYLKTNETKVLTIDPLKMLSIYA